MFKLNRRIKPSPKETHGRIFKEILVVKGQLRDLLEAQIRMELKMSMELDNLKTAVADAVTEIVAAIDRINGSDNPAEVQAEADKLNAAVADLKAALGH